jgi:hypothetical protein
MFESSLKHRVGHFVVKKCGRNLGGFQKKMVDTISKPDVDPVHDSVSPGDSIPKTIVSPEPHIWREKVLFAVITVPRNKHKLEALQKNLAQKSFPSPYVHYNVQFSNDATVEEEDKVIAFGHYSLTKVFCNWNTERKYHLMIMEDDCQFFRGDVAGKVGKHLDYLDRYRPEWKILFIGHVPMGPVWFTQWGLVNTQLPFTGHCYILNGKHLPELLDQIPLDKWKRCTANEAWRTIPASEKFAVFPALATQTERPKEMSRMPFMGMLSTTTWFQCVEWCMVLVTIVIILFIIIVVVIALIVFTHYLSVFVSML